MKINNIFIKPHITEKTMGKSASGEYSFIVDKRANKYQIRQAAEKLFKVTVERVSTYSRRGKVRRVGKRMKQRSLPDRKIAIIKVSKGKIDLFPES